MQHEENCALFWANFSPAIKKAVASYVRKVLGTNLKHEDRCRRHLAGHHIWRFAYNPGFDFSTHEADLRRSLDVLDWQLIVIGTVTVEYVEQGKEQTLNQIGIAPITLVNPISVAYHATTLATIEKILVEGLLPSNHERRMTNYPDTVGVIHVCEELDYQAEETKSARWWMNKLRSESCSADSWGIVRIDMRGISSARVYQDMHSPAGLVVDRIERIPPNLITQVPLEKTGDDT